MSARVEVYREDLSGIELPKQYRRADFFPKPVWGGWRWRYVSSNGRIMADGSQSYSRRIDCLNGCATVLGGVAWNGNASNTYIERHDRASAANVYEQIPVVDLTRKAKP